MPSTINVDPRVVRQWAKGFLDRLQSGGFADAIGIGADPYFLRDVLFETSAQKYGDILLNEEGFPLMTKLGQQYVPLMAQRYPDNYDKAVLEYGEVFNGQQIPKVTRDLRNDYYKQLEAERKARRQEVFANADGVDPTEQALIALQRERATEAAAAQEAYRLAHGKSQTFDSKDEFDAYLAAMADTIPESSVPTKSSILQESSNPVVPPPPRRMSSKYTGSSADLPRNNPAPSQGQTINVVVNDVPVESSNPTVPPIPNSSNVNVIPEDPVSSIPWWSPEANDPRLGLGGGASLLGLWYLNQQKEKEQSTNNPMVQAHLARQAMGNHYGNRYGAHYGAHYGARPTSFRDDYGY